eukprot:512687-Alexandrium_andersonii.AAC.1
MGGGLGGDANGYGPASGTLLLSPSGSSGRPAVEQCVPVGAAPAGLPPGPAAAWWELDGWESDGSSANLRGTSGRTPTTDGQVEALA